MKQRSRSAPARRSSTEAVYFAYGSNLDRVQMRVRCPSAVVEARALLHGYAIAFGGWSARWGGAVASITPVHGARVEGLLYRIRYEDLDLLDRFEGSPFAYQRITKMVSDEAGRRRRVQVYLQVRDFFGEPRYPAASYFKVILREYKRLGFRMEPLAAAIGVELP